MLTGPSILEMLTQVKEDGEVCFNDCLIINQIYNYICSQFYVEKDNSEEYLIAQKQPVPPYL